VELVLLACAVGGVAAACSGVREVRLADRDDWWLELHRMGTPELVVYLQYPDAAQGSCRRVPGLKATLDGAAIETHTEGHYTRIAFGHGEGCHVPAFFVPHLVRSSDGVGRLVMTDGTRTLRAAFGELAAARRANGAGREPVRAGSEVHFELTPPGDERGPLRRVFMDTPRPPHLDPSMISVKGSRLTVSLPAGLASGAYDIAFTFDGRPPLVACEGLTRCVYDLRDLPYQGQLLVAP
jgi:hypothetical protein